MVRRWFSANPEIHQRLQVRVLSASKSFPFGAELALVFCFPVGSLCVASAINSTIN